MTTSMKRPRRTGIAETDSVALEFFDGETICVSTAWPDSRHSRAIGRMQAGSWAVRRLICRAVSAAGVHRTSRPLRSAMRRAPAKQLCNAANGLTVSVPDAVATGVFDCMVQADVESA